MEFEQEFSSKENDPKADLKEAHSAEKKLAAAKKLLDQQAAGRQLNPDEQAKVEMVSTLLVQQDKARRAIDILSTGLYQPRDSDSEYDA